MNSIAKKSMLALSSASIIVMLIVFSISYIIAGNQTEDQLAEQIDETNSTLAVVMLEPLYAYDSDIIDDVASAFVKYPYIHQIKVFDQRNKELSKAIETGPAPSKFVIVKKELPIFWTDKSSIGKIEIIYRTDTIGEQMTSTLITYFLIAIILLVALQLVNWLTLNTLVIKPVSLVNDALADIAAGGGDLTKRIVVSSNDEIGHLSTNFNKFINHLQDLISSISVTVDDVSQQSGVMSHNAQLSVEALDRQLQETEQVATALNEMTATAAEVGSHAAKTSENTMATSEIASEADMVIQGSISQINLLSNEMESTSQKISSLRDNSDSIGTVLSVIKGIADQTNLLALNAAIEAARAGEQGRGFAVVADEVRSLAQRTQESTQEIETIIKELQLAANNAFKSMNSSHSMIGESVTQSERAGAALTLINEKIYIINDMNSQIANASSEQSSVAEEINKNVTEIHGFSKQVSKQAIEIKTNCESMMLNSNGLKQKLSQFIV
jgi:methyl-accepting chemotaxis protein